MNERPYNHNAIVVKDSRHNNLHIGWDDEDGFVMLFTPDMENTSDHYHIELSEKEAAKLTLFLEKKLVELRAKRGDWKRAREILNKAHDVEPEIDDRL